MQESLRRRKDQCVRLKALLIRKINKLSFPTSWYGQFSVMFVADFISFFVIVANTRAFTQGSYFWTLVTDLAFGFQGFCIAKIMIDNKEARSWASGLGATCGGASGSLASIWATVHLYGK